MCGVFDQMRVHLAKRCAFGQMPCVSSIAQMRWAFDQMHTAQIDQIRLTSAPHANLCKFSFCKLKSNIRDWPYPKP